MQGAIQYGTAHRRPMDKGTKLLAIKSFAVA